MTIEKSPPSTEPKHTGASDTKTSKARAGSAGGNEASALGGFMAILSAVDTSGVNPVVDDGAQDALASAAQAAALAALGEQADGAGAALGPGAAGTGSGLDNAALLAQTLQMLPAAPAELTDLSRADALGDAPLSLQGNAWGQAAPAMPAPAPASASASASAAATQGLAVADERASPVARKPPMSGKPKADPLDAAQLASGAPAQQQTPSGISAAVEARITALAQKAQASPSAAMATPAMAAMASNFMRREGEGQERSVFKVGATDAAAPAAASGAFSLSGAPPAAANAVVVSAPVEVYLAEQVKYWISNDVKNAEMKLEGLGQELVEVSISMHGNEAHVAFRTDELQARTALEGAASHLKDLLAREGVLLAGVSVGTSGSQNPDAQDRRARQNGARQATVVSGAVAPAGQAVSRSGGVPGGAVGRALDLFV
jgi:flagellar hook-length control protein FliK